MRYQSVNTKFVRRNIFLVAAILLFTSLSFAQVPKPQSPPRLVNDFASVFSSSQRQSLENELVKFSEETSNQIAIVTMDDLGGMEASQMAYSIGEQWGVGDSRFNNGIVILIKPKRGNSYGDLYIEVGYGLEGAIPDAIAKRIVENEMIPQFREDNYYQGVVNALNILMPLAKGEYSYEDYSGDDEIPIGFIVLFIVIFLILILSSKNNNNKNIGSGGSKSSSFLNGFIWGSILSGSGGSSSSGGSFGGGISGGFGGFGGGSFGGGGAGGRW